MRSKLLQLLILIGMLIPVSSSAFQTMEWKSGYGLPGLSGLASTVVKKGNDLFVFGGLYLENSSEMMLVAKYDGQNWSEVVGYPNENYATEAILVGDIIYVATYNGLYSFNGTTWSELTETLPDSKIAKMSGMPAGLHYDGNVLHIFGDITVANTTIRYHTTWDGTSFGTRGAGFNGIVRTITGSTNALYFGGAFTKSADEQVVLRGAARWDGISLTEPFFVGDNDAILSMVRVVPNSTNNLDAPVLYIAGMNIITDGSGNSVYNKIAKFESGIVKALRDKDNIEIGVTGHYDARLLVAGDSVWYHDYTSFLSISDKGKSANYYDKFVTKPNAGKPYIFGNEIYLYSQYYVSFDYNVAGPVIKLNLETNQFSDYRGTSNQHAFYGDVQRIIEWKNELYAFGNMYYSDLSKQIVGMAKKTSNGWEAINSNADFINSISKVITDDDNIYIAGSFNNVGPNKDLDNIVVYDGTTLSSPFDGSPNSYVNDVELVDGNLFIAGGFTMIGDKENHKGLARYRNGQFRDMNYTLDGGYNFQDIFVEPFDDGGFTNYRLFVSGFFNNFNGNEAADYVVYYNGESWAPIGGEFVGSINGIARYQDTVYVSHFYGANVRVNGQNESHYLSKWNGTQWTRAIPTLNRPIQRMQATEEGLYLYGFTFAPINGVSLYDGTTLNNNLIPSGLRGLVYDYLNFGDSVMVASSLQPHGAGLAVASSNTGVSISETDLLPNQFELGQNYPNPFNPSTIIPINVHQTGAVTMTVYSALGQKVATLISNEMLTKGSYEIGFDASNLASGIYFYQLKAGSKVMTKQMVLIK